MASPPLINIEGCMFMYDVKKDSHGNIHLRLNNKAKEFFKSQEDDLLFQFSTFGVSPDLKLPDIKIEPPIIPDGQPPQSKKRMRTSESSKKIIHNGSTKGYTDVREFLDLNLTGLEIKMCSIADAKFETAIKMNQLIEIVNNKIPADDKKLFRNVRNKESLQYIISHCTNHNISFYIELLLSSGSCVHFKTN